MDIHSPCNVHVRTYTCMYAHAGSMGAIYGWYYMSTGHTLFAIYFSRIHSSSARYTHWLAVPMLATALTCATKLPSCAAVLASSLPGTSHNSLSCQQLGQACASACKEVKDLNRRTDRGDNQGLHRGDNQGFYRGAHNQGLYRGALFSKGYCSISSSEVSRVDMSITSSVSCKDVALALYTNTECMIS